MKQQQRALSRRVFVGQSLALVAGIAFATFKPMRNVILLGDSILDNRSYTGGKPEVIAQLRQMLPASWNATLLAKDGATTEDIPTQLSRLPNDASHLVVSIGGNNALRQSHVLDFPVKSSAEALLALAQIAQDFDGSYRAAVDACRQHRLPLIICTIYNGNFPDKNYQKRAAIALAALNDVIIRIGVEQHLTILELRHLCNKPEDFANPIEPSTIGGAKIAKAIVQAVMLPATRPEGAVIYGARQR